MAYELVQAKSGKAIDDLYTPEIKSDAYNTNDPATIYPYDAKHAKVQSPYIIEVCILPLQFHAL